MRKNILGTVTRVVLPPLLGAGGALLATMAPAYYAAMCGGAVVGL